MRKSGWHEHRTPPRPGRHFVVLDRHDLDVVLVEFFVETRVFGPDNSHVVVDSHTVAPEMMRFLISGRDELPVAHELGQPGEPALDRFRHDDPQAFTRRGKDAVSVLPASDAVRIEFERVNSVRLGRRQNSRIPRREPTAGLRGQLAMSPQRWCRC